jgi:nonribosomal peptide synthetase DhbF
MGGESVQLGVVRRFLETGDWHSDRRPDAVNMYGITETTVFSTIQRLEPGFLRSSERRSPIGEPLPHVDLKLFVRAGVEVAGGEIGEIYIGGASVSGGYVGRPELTAERFVVLAGSDGRAARYYRTGDLACRSEHGLEYCGRIDYQVKLKGFRIELQEVERAIAALSYIDIAAVTLESNRRGLPVLVAFVVPIARDEARDFHASVRRDLQQTLPPYMIPSHVIRRDALPVTSSGKCDRELLSAFWRDRRAPTPGAAARV